jgi:hypothetical protein
MDPKKLAALLAGPEDMSASVDTIPADSGFLSKLANALATMPTVQSIKEMVQYPTQVARGEKQVPQTFAPEAGAAGDEAVGWGLGNAVLPSVAMGIPRAFMSNPGRSAEFGIFGGRGAKRAYHGSPHEELAAALRDGGPAVSSKAMPEFETIFRGENSGNKGGSYYSTDRDWARQFTQSGLDKEVKARKISKADIYEAPELPRAVDELAMDRAMAEAKERGFKAIRVDEGRGEPPSVFILDKSALKL